jgi:HEAT repeat protein
MPEPQKQPEQLSPEIQELMRTLVSAIRVVKLYPSNNPLYVQSVKKAFEALERFFATETEFTVTVQKNGLAYRHIPIGKDAQLNKAIAQDLFAKGLRELQFTAGLTETELLELCRAAAWTSEELAMKSGISSVLWEKGATHIKVTESGLDEVITSKTDGRSPETAISDGLKKTSEKMKQHFEGRTLVLGGLVSDPAGFGASMLELAMRTRAAHESVEDRLYALYQEAGRKIEKEHAQDNDSMFKGLAESVLALEASCRDGLIAGKLYRDLDEEMAGEQDAEQQIPTVLQEIQTGRFSNAWTVQQVATLLKKAAGKKTAVSPPPLPSPEQLAAVPLAEDFPALSKELAEYTPEELTGLKVLNDAGMESDILEAAVRTLVYLLPQVKNALRSDAPERVSALITGVVRQLEEMLSYLLQKKAYDSAAVIARALQTQADPEFQPRMAEALKKNAGKATILAIVGDMKSRSKDSPEYQSAYSYLSVLEKEATEVLLEFLAEEPERGSRIFYLDLAKDLGKNQIALLGEHLMDGRWYFVRNIVNILGDSKTDQAIAFLRKAADHENIRIRQEVIRGLLTIGGKKAAAVLAKFLRDRDPDIQMTAVRAFADFPGVGAEESRPIITFLEGRPLKKRDQALTLEAIKSLGKTGGREAAELLKKYTRVRWWKPRALQVELKRAAEAALQDIARRKNNDGRTTKQPG